MWKAAFSGRSETGSSSGRKKKSGSEVGSSSSRRHEDGRRRSEKSRGGGSTYGDDDERSSSYVTAHTSRKSDAPRGLTESAVRMLDDDDEWEDEDKDARSVARSERTDRTKERRRSDKGSTRNRSHERSDEKSRKSSLRDKDSSRRKSRIVDEGDERAIPDMGSFEQFPGSNAGSAIMSGALPGSAPAPDNQFGLTRADTFGQASDYYGDEGQSVAYQPGYRAKSPNMLVNADPHLLEASAEAHPVADTGHGSAADFYSGKVSPVLTAEPEPMTPGKPSSSSTKPHRPSKASSLGAAAAGVAAAGAAAIGAAASNGRHSSQSQSQYQASSTSYPPQNGVSPGRPSNPSLKPNRQNSAPANSSGAASSYYTSSQQQDSGTYYGPPPGQIGPSPGGSYYGPPPQQQPSGNSGKQSSHSNAGLYAAGAAAAGAAGLAAYEMHEHHQNHQQQQNGYMASNSQYGGSQYGRQPSYGPQQGPYMNGGMSMYGDQHFHEHKGPMTRLKDGFLNLISNEEDVMKMEEYTQYIGVCRYCFDPRTRPDDAPRVHHYHPGRDSFEDLRRRRSIERMRKRSKEYLGRTSSTRVDKDNRYYSSDSKRRQSGGLAGPVAAGVAAGAAVAGASALFNDRKNFDDTYSVKSGHRESSAVRRQSRSSSREKRRRSSHGVIGRDSGDEYRIVRTQDGHTVKERIRRRSTSRDRKTGLMGAATGAALGAAAVGAASGSQYGHRPSTNGAFVRRHSHSRSRSHSPEEGGIFGNFFSPPQRRRRDSRPERRKKQGGFFNFGNGSFSSSDEDMAFGEGFSSKTNLPLRRKSSGRVSRKRKSDEHLAATVAGIGATAAALAAAQRGHRVSKRTSRPELGAKKNVANHRHHAAGDHGQRSSDDEWEDELPSDVDDASSVGSDLAFHEDRPRPSHRQSMESIGSQSSDGGIMGAWGWRWGGKDKRRKQRPSSPPPSYPPRANGSSIGAAAAGVGAAAAAGAALDSMGRPTYPESVITSASSVPQRPMQYVDPRPMSDAGSLAGSRHASMPGAFDEPVYNADRPDPTPIQHPRPKPPIQPTFTQNPDDIDPHDAHRPAPPRRTQSSPTQSSLIKDAALIGAAAIGTTAFIASQKSRNSKDVRFGLTEEQERKHERESRREREKAEAEERRRTDRERDLKEEAARHTREQDVLRARAEENRRAAQAELDRQQAAQREAEQQAEMDREKERQRQEREDAYNRGQARIAEETRQREEARRQRDLREQEIQAELERKRRELEDQERYDRDRRSESRRESEHQERAESHTSIPWGAVAAGAAVAGAGAYAAHEYERNKEHEREQERRYDDRSASNVEMRDGFAAQEIRPTNETSGQPLQDDDLNDPELFKRRRSDSDGRRASGRDRRSARDVVAERESYYNAPPQSQAEFFAPKEILEHASEPKAKNNTPDSAQSEFDRTWGVSQSGRSRHAPYGVPKLGLISPTPPPSAPPSAKRTSIPSTSPLAQSETTEPQVEVGAEPEEEPERVPDTPSAGRKSTRSRSISWGVDQTHVYEVPTPDSHQERDSYIERHEVPIAAAAAATVAGAAAMGIAASHEAADKSSEKDSESKSYAREESERDRDRRRYVDEAEDDDVEEVVDSRESSTYQRPFYESVSDIGLGRFGVDSPGTEGVPPVQGYVEGEVAETPAEEKERPHMPGGFDDEYDVPSEFHDVPAPESEYRLDDREAQYTKDRVEDVDARSSRETPTAEPEPEAETAWEPPLSKKEKKKREKAAKRASTIDNEPAPVTTREITPEEPQASVIPQEDPYEGLSKKERKKREKAAKRGYSEDWETTSREAEPSQPPEEPAESQGVSNEPIEPAWEPPLSKKEKKKREKEAKKQGFADVAETVMTAGGIAAVTAGAVGLADKASSSSEKGSAWSNAPEPERDIRDIEPSKDVASEAHHQRQSSMPGGWDNETQDQQVQSPSEVVDPFQFQVHDESPPQPTTPSTDRYSAVPESTSTRSKRDSLRFNEPATSSPLRAEVPQDDYIGRATETSTSKVEPEKTVPETNGYSQESDLARYENMPSYVATTGDQRSRNTTYDTDERRVTESPSRMSPDDLRSVASDPTGERESKRRSKGDRSRADDDYYERDHYDDARSVAASEPADAYESSRRSKRRSHRDDDDTASVTSSRSRRDKDDKDSKKDKKGGIFGGLFSRKSTDSVPTSRSDGAPLSRQSTRESREDDGEDGEHRHRRRRHRDSEYGDDDTRSVTSESRHRHRRDSEYGDDDTRSVTSESRRKHHRSHSERERDDDTVEGRTESRHRHHRSHSERDDDRSSRYADEDDRVSESGHRHHHRRRTEDDAASSSRRDDDGHRHHHRRRTDDETYDKDQSFLGMRVEDMPPLPVSRPGSPDSASAKQERDIGIPVSAEPESYFEDHGMGDHSTSEPRGEDNIHSSSKVEDAEQTSGEDQDMQGSGILPAEVESPPASPPPAAEDESRPRRMSLQRPTSTTAVPVRFPFGSQPLTPGSHRMERAISFGGSLPQSPATPGSSGKTRQGRPQSSEIRPFYLLERTRQTPEVEEGLPSLPSSKPSSRASSMIGDDEYESAVEEAVESVPRRGLMIDTGQASTYKPENDYLDSQQTTPKASEFSQAVFDKPPRQEPEYYTYEDLARETRPARQEPQYYTWEDFAREERMHDAAAVADDGKIRPEINESESGDRDVPAVQPARSSSPMDVGTGTTAAGALAAAAALGGAAVLAHHAFDKDNGEQPAEATKEATSPIEEHAPANAPQTLSAATTDIPAEHSQARDVEMTDAAVTEAPEPVAPTEDTMLSESPVEYFDAFAANEKMVEEGEATGPVQQLEVGPRPQPNQLDSFLEDERRIEEGRIDQEEAQGRPFVPLNTTEDSSIATGSTEVPGSKENVDDTNDPAPDDAQVSEDATTASKDIVEPAPEEVDEDTVEFMQAEEQLEAGGPRARVDEVADTIPGDSVDPMNVTEPIQLAEEAGLSRDQPIQKNPELEPAAEEDTAKIMESEERLEAGIPGTTDDEDATAFMESEERLEAGVESTSTIGRADVLRDASEERMDLSEPSLLAEQEASLPMEEQPAWSQDGARSSAINKSPNDALPEPLESRVEATATALLTKSDTRDIGEGPSFETAPKLTRKQSKKAKKRQKAAATFSDATEEPMDTPEPAPRVEEDIDLSRDEPLGQDQDESEHIAFDETSTSKDIDPAPTLETPPLLTRKQSKKAKKKQKAAAEFADTTDEPTEITEPATLAEEAAGLPQSEEPARDEAEPEPVAFGETSTAKDIDTPPTLETAPLLTRKQSKKAKKNKKAAARLALDDESQPSGVETPETAEDVPVEDLPTADQSIPRDEYVDESSASTSAPLVATSTMARELSEATRSESEVQPNVIKAEASVMPTVATATVHTLLDPMDSTAANALSATLSEDQVATSQDTAERESASNTRDAVDEQDTSAQSEDPILQPDQEESWEAFPTVSRSKSKKAKKKDRQRLQREESSTSQPPKDSMNTVQEAQVVPPNTVTEIPDIAPEDLALPVDDDRDLEDTGEMKQEDAGPEDVALPLDDDHDLEDTGASEPPQQSIGEPYPSNKVDNEGFDPVEALHHGGSRQAQPNGEDFASTDRMDLDTEPVFDQPAADQEPRSLDVSSPRNSIAPPEESNMVPTDDTDERDATAYDMTMPDAHEDPAQVPLPSEADHELSSEQDAVMVDPVEPVEFANEDQDLVAQPTTIQSEAQSFEPAESDGRMASEESTSVPEEQPLEATPLGQDHSGATDPEQEAGLESIKSEPEEAPNAFEQEASLNESPITVETSHGGERELEPAVEESPSFSTKSSKKTKKGKKGKGKAAEAATEEVTVEAADSSMPTVAAEVDDSQQTTEVEGSDFWSTPVKGKKGKKAKGKADNKANDKFPVEDVDSPIPATSTDFDDDSKQTTEVEGSDFWSIPAKNKKGKKSKKTKTARFAEPAEAENEQPEVAAQADEPSSSTAVEQPEAMINEPDEGQDRDMPDTTAMQGADSMESVDADKPANRVIEDSSTPATLDKGDQTELPPLPDSPALETTVEAPSMEAGSLDSDTLPENLQEQDLSAQTMTDIEPASVEEPDENKSESRDLAADENFPTETAEPEPAVPFTISTGKKKKKGKKSRSSAVDIWSEEPSQEPVSSAAEADAPQVEGSIAEDVTTPSGTERDVSSSQPEPVQEKEEEWPTFSTKPSKKAKRKSKKSGSSTPAVEADPKESEMVTAPLEQTQDSASREMDTGSAQEAFEGRAIAALEDSIPVDSSADPSDAFKTTHEPAGSDHAGDSSFVHESDAMDIEERMAEGKEREVDMTDAASPAVEHPEMTITDEATTVPLPEERPEEWQEESSGQARRDDMLEEPDTIAPHEELQQEPSIPSTHEVQDGEEQRDDDFTHTVAGALEQSGFSPDIIMNDPIFQRRESPTGVAEADPEEVFAATSSQKRKRDKRKKTRGVDVSPDDEQPKEDSKASDDFNDVLEQSLAATGFDSALVQQAASSSNDISSNDLAGDSAEFSFTTPKRKKSKKSKKRATFTDDDTPPAEVFHTSDKGVEPAELESTSAEPNADNPTPVDGQGLPVDQEAMVSEPYNVQQTAEPSDITDTMKPHDATTAEMVPEDSQTVIELPDPAADLVMAGERDLDVDEMDRAYKAFKKNKRNKKKKKAASSQSETVSEAETPNVTERDEPSFPSAFRVPASSRFEDPDFQMGDTAHRESRDLDTPIEDEVQEDAAREASTPIPVVPMTGNDLETFHEDQRMPPPEREIPPPGSNDEIQHSSSRYPDEQPSHLDSAGGLVAAGVAAAGVGATLERTISSHHSSSHSLRHRQSSERSLGLLPGDRRDHSPSATKPWSFANLEDEGQPLPESPVLGDKEHQIARDSGYQEAKSPMAQRSSGSSSHQAVPEIRTAQSRESLSSRRSTEPLRISVDNGSDWNLNIPKSRDLDEPSEEPESSHSRNASIETAQTPLQSTTKNRASYLFQTTPENLKEQTAASDIPTPSQKSEASDYFRTKSREEFGDDDQMDRVRSSSFSDRPVFSPPPAGTMSPRGPLDTIPEEHHAQKRTITEAEPGQPENIKAIRRTETPQAIRAREREFSPNALPPITIPSSGRSVSDAASSDQFLDRLSWPHVDEDSGTVDIDRSLKGKAARAMPVDRRSPSVMSSRSNASAGASATHARVPEELRSFSRTSNRSSTPTLRRVDRSLSGDLRAASRRGETGSAVGARASPKTIPFEPPPTPPLNDDELMDEGASRSADMSDVYQGYGDAAASQVSPTRPPNMRKRQSMHIMDLESKLDQLTAENKALQDERQARGIASDPQDNPEFHDALNARDLQLREKENEITQIRTMLQPMQEEIARLTEINGGLTEANRNLVDDTNGRYAQLQEENAQMTRDLESMRGEHSKLTSGMRSAVEAEIATALADKNSEVRRLREELDVASEQIRSLQVQIRSSKSRDYLTVRDEDYFDGACQKLCQHVQQWVLRFSKLSDNRVCRLSTDLKDDKVEARLDNAILDGSDVDKLLVDRVKRRDVFMSVVMTMVWEYVFTRYLFGMDREQRQKLKTLEKTLAEVGPPRAVAQWRATTLTLLAKRPSFAEQRDLDTEAVANEIFGLLCSLLPPPSSSEQQLLASLLKVIGIAVDLSIEMRTQRAEYIMLPPLQPEYDTNGDLVRKVHFNASLMNERSGMFSSNEELEDTRAVVKIVLFPLVVKKGDEFGEGDEEIVVCPAQVLVQNENGKGKKIVRVQSGALEIEDPRRSRGSLISNGNGSTAF